MKNFLFFLKLFVIAIVFLACSSTKKVGSTSPTNETPAITIPEGKALVYIIRPQFMGFAINFKVTVNEKYIGFTKGKTYLYVIVEPGKVNILSQAENKEEIQFVAEANKKYYVEQTPTMGVLKARNKLEVITDQASGEEKLAKCKLSKGIEKQ